MLKKTARSLVFAGIVIFGATGAAYAAGAGDQTGQYGDMSGHGGPVDKKGSSAGQSGQGASSGQGSDRPRSSTSGQGVESRRVFIRGSSMGQGAGSSGSSASAHPAARERVLPGNRVDRRGLLISYSGRVAEAEPELPLWIPMAPV